MMLSEVDRVPTLLKKMSNDSSSNLYLTPQKNELSISKSMSNITE